MAIYTVDYGHTLSGGDTGAGGNGLREENLTREIGRLVVQGLQKEGHTVHPIELDHATSLTASLNYRVDRIIKINPDQSVSIHINAFANLSATGVEVWGDNLCKDKCMKICSNISNEFGLVNRGFKNGCDSLALVGLYGSASIPAMLVECFFISNSDDCSKYNAQKYADCIVSGLLNKTVTGNPTQPEPQPPKPSVPSGAKNYLFLNAHVGRWNVYPTNVAPIKGNQCGVLTPSAFGGLEYEILANPQADVYTIYTESYGKVNIYVPKDGDSKFYSRGGQTITPPAPSNTKYLNLHPHNASWRVYGLTGACTVGNEVGKLAPSNYGGLSYAILGDEGDIKTIQTSSFGKVRIYAPQDNDSSITASPKY